MWESWGPHNAYSRWKPHYLAQHLRAPHSQNSANFSSTTSCLPKTSSHPRVAAPELATILQMCHPFCTPWLYTCFPSFQTKHKSHSLSDASPDPPGWNWGSLSWILYIPALQPSSCCAMSVSFHISFPGLGTCWRICGLCYSCLFIPRHGTECTVDKSFGVNEGHRETAR